MQKRRNPRLIGEEDLRTQRRAPVALMTYNARVRARQACISKKHAGERSRPGPLAGEHQRKEAESDQQSGALLIQRKGAKRSGGINKGKAQCPTSWPTRAKRQAGAADLGSLDKLSRNGNGCSMCTGQFVAHARRGSFFVISRRRGTHPLGRNRMYALPISGVILRHCVMKDSCVSQQLQWGVAKRMNNQHRQQAPREEPCVVSCEDCFLSHVVTSHLTQLRFFKSVLALPFYIFCHTSPPYETRFLQVLSHRA